MGITLESFDWASHKLCHHVHLNIIMIMCSNYFHFYFQTILVKYSDSIRSSQFYKDRAQKFSKSPLVLLTVEYGKTNKISTSPANCRVW